MSAKATCCPCGGTDYLTCCGRYHGGLPVPDAEALMRSRYSAYALGLDGYLLSTWHSDTRPAALDFAADTVKWMGLEIKNSTLESANQAVVEFVARYKIVGRAHRMHEISRFACVGGQWFYVDGKFPDGCE